MRHILVPTDFSDTATAALDGPQDCIALMVDAFKSRHDYLLNALNEIPGISCTPSDGTFYAFANFKALIDQNSAGIDTDTALCEHFIADAQVAIVPGTAFGAPGYARFSYATSQRTLEKAVERIAASAEKIFKG